MPPISKIRHNNHGRPLVEELLLQKDMIADQTFDYLVNIYNPANWTFTVGEGLGNSVTGAAAAYALSGSSKNARVTAGFKFLGNSNYNQGLVFRYRILGTPSVAGTGNFYLGRVFSGNIFISVYVAAVPTVLTTVALVDPPADGDIFRLTGEVVDSNLYLLYENQARSNDSGAAPYNLAGIDGGNPVTLTLVANGVSQTITFASTDPLIANFAAVAEAEVLAVLNSQLVGAVAHADFAASLTTIAALGVGTSSVLTITGGTANPVLGFNTTAYTGAKQSISASDTTHPWGFCGIWTNSSKHYWRDVKVEAI
jgi:hypothetical protein